MTKQLTIEDLQMQITQNLAATSRILREAATRAEAADKRAAEADARAAEADKRAAKADARAAENEKKFAKYRAEAAERDAKAEKEMAALRDLHARGEKETEKLRSLMDEGKKETAKLRSLMDEGKKETAKLRSLMTGYTTADGEILEYDVAATITEKKKLGDLKFDDVLTNEPVHTKDGSAGEFDLICLNGDTTVVGETKRTLARGDARHFLHDRIELFKRAFPQYAKGKKVRAALIYQRANHGAVQEALNLKMLVFRAESDQTLRPIAIPTDNPTRNTPKSQPSPRKSA